MTTSAPPSPTPETGAVPADWTSRPRVLAALLVLVALPYAASGSLVSDFVFDDIKLVRDNAEIRDLSGIVGTFDITSDRWRDNEVRANYRPLRFLSYALDYRLTRWVYGDFEPARMPVLVFHLSNLLLHLANTLLVVAIARRLLGSGPAALLVGAVFGLHPVQTEAVVYISGRRDVLSTFFFLAALRVFLGSANRGVRDGATLEPRSAARQDLSWTAVVLVPLLFAAGFFAKEMVITLPALLLVIDVIRRARPRPARVTLHALLWGIAASFVAVKVSNPDLVAAPLGGSTGSTLLTIPRYVLRYLGLVLFPVDQSIDYSYDAIPVSTSLASPWTTIPSLLGASLLLCLGLVALHRPRALVALGTLWFLGTLTPVLQIVPIAERFAERFVYLPSIGIFLLVGAGFRRWRALARRPAVAGAIFVVLVCGLANAHRAAEWRSPRTLWASAAEAQPRCARAHIGHGNALRDLGEPHLAGAARAYSRAIEILQEDPAGLEAEPLRRGHLLQARNFRADVLMRLGASDSARYHEAINDYRWLIGQTDVDGTRIGESPRYLVLLYHLGLCELAVNEPGEAREAFASILEIAARQPDDLEPGHLSYVRAAHYYTAKILLAEGRAEAAVEFFAAAYKLARKRGTVSDRYHLVGEYADALIELRELDRAGGLLGEVIEELADDPERKHLLFRVARILDLRGEVDAAARTLEDALALDPDFGPALLSLAGIEENRGDLDRAEALYRRVMALAPGNTRAQRGLESVAIKRALRKQPESNGATAESLRVIRGLISRGRGHLERGELFAAEDLLQRAADADAVPELNPLRGEALRLLGRVAERLNQFGDAEGYYLASLEADPDAHESLLALADLVLAQRGDREKAARLYGQYVDLFRGEERGASHAYYNLGVLLASREPERALELLRIAERAGHESAALWSQIGFLEARLGHWDAALESFQRFLGSEAGDPEKARVRAYIERNVLPNLPGGDVLRERSASPTPGERPADGPGGADAPAGARNER